MQKPKTERAGYGKHCRVWFEGFGASAAWYASWNGQRAPATFLSKEAARAYLATCDVAGKLRS